MSHIAPPPPDTAGANAWQRVASSSPHHPRRLPLPPQSPSSCSSTPRTRTGRHLSRRGGIFSPMRRSTGVSTLARRQIRTHAAQMRAKLLANRTGQSTTATQLAMCKAAPLGGRRTRLPSTFPRHLLLIRSPSPTLSPHDFSYEQTRANVTFSPATLPPQPLPPPPPPLRRHNQRLAGVSRPPQMGV